MAIFFNQNTSSLDYKNLEIYPQVLTFLSFSRKIFLSLDSQKTYNV